MTYTINQGNHYHTLAFIPTITFENTISYECTLTDSCLYTLSGVNAYDWNKLIGLSTTYNQHQNSARIGWRTDSTGKQFELLPYVYVAGKRLNLDILTPQLVQPNEPFSVAVTDTEFSYEIKINEKEYEYSKQPDSPIFNWVLKPYFGGQATAPHKMQVILTKN